jgi:hypothetical protein
LRIADFGLRIGKEKAKEALGLKIADCGLEKNNGGYFGSRLSDGRWRKWIWADALGFISMPNAHFAIRNPRSEIVRLPENA